METFKKGDKIGRYTVNEFIKKGASAESYTVYGGDDVLYFLKVYDMASLPKSQLLEGKEVPEIVFCKELNEESNDNVIRFVDNGGVRKGDKEFHYLVTEFYYGQLLNESVEKDGLFDVDDAVQITLCVLNGLQYMHSKALLHNDIRPSNIMLKELDDGMMLPTIIDLGHVSYMVLGRPNFMMGDLAPFFRAPETYRGIFTPKSDVFSVGALLYYLIFGVAPWEVDLADCHGDKNQIKAKVREARKAELVLDTESVHLPDYLKEILKKALSLRVVSRFASAADFFNVLLDRLIPEGLEDGNEMQSQEEIKKGSGNGFDMVAGRDELKDRLRKEVIFPLQNPEKAKLYQLPPVNGILLYGPPGCGKSLVVKSFAEELGFNYTVLNAAELGNIYQQGVIDNIQRVFDAATVKAPFVIGLEGIEYLLPNPGEENITKERVEMLNMINNCAERGILLVATSNQPEMVDPFLMRPGCIDRVFFVPQPDFEARKDIFRKHLSNRPCDEIDYEELARLSDDFVAGDITEAVNEAAMTAAFMDVPISQKILVDVLKYKNPTYSTKTKIGFNK